MCITDHCNDAEVTTAMPKHQMSHGLLALFEKIYYEDPIFPVVSNIEEDIQ
jgi:hypothetical protein